jgi:Ca-activated chloride channel family protein
MSFQWSSMLWLLLLVPALVLLYLWAQRRRQKYAVRYASLMLVKDALGRGPGFRRHIPALLFLIAVAVMILALARPFATISLPSNRGTVILAMDISGSMRAQDIKPSRFEAEKEAARAFVDKQPSRVRIGIAAFSATATLVQPPTTVRDDIRAALERLRPQRGTAIGSGILVALDAISEDEQQRQPPEPAAAPAPNDLLQPAAPAPEPDPVPPGSNSSAVIVLLTDGQNNQGPDPLDAADKAANRGIRIFTVGLGTAQGDVIGFEGRSFRVSLDEASLKKIAQNTGGQYFKARDAGDLLNIYKTLSTRLIVGKDQTEVTALFTAIAMALLLVAGILSLLWFNRLP